MPVLPITAHLPQMVKCARVLAIDPSLRSTGYGVLEKKGTQLRVLDYGLIRNFDKLLPSGCLVAIHERLLDLIAQHQPDCAAVGSVIYVQSYRTAIILGSARAFCGKPAPSPIAVGGCLPPACGDIVRRSG